MQVNWRHYNYNLMSKNYNYKFYINYKINLIYQIRKKIFFGSSIFMIYKTIFINWVVEIITNFF